MPTKKLNFAFWLVALAATVFMGHASSQASPPITVKTHISIPAVGGTSSYELVAFASEKGSEPDILTATWAANSGGFFPVWYITLRSPLGLLPGGQIQVGPFAPKVGSTYEAVTSYDAERGTLAFSFADRDQTRILFSDAWSVQPLAQSVHVALPSTDQVQVLEGYAPVEATWGIGRSLGEGFEIGTVFESGDDLVIRVNAKIGASGEFRVVAKDGTSTQTLASAPAQSGMTLLRVPTHVLPLGSTALGLEYVDGSTVYTSETRKIVVGGIEVNFDVWKVDPATKRLSSTITLRTESPLHDIQLTFDTAIHSMTWDAARGRYTETPYSIEHIDITLPKTLQPGTTRLPVSVPIPDDPGLWSASFTLSATPDVNIRKISNDRTTFSTGPGSGQGGASLRLCTYNVNHFQGWPEARAVGILGTHAQRVNHFTHILSVLDCDAIALQEAGSQPLLSDLALRLDQSLAVYPSAQSVGGLIARHKLPQTRFYNQAAPQSKAGPFGRFLAASLLDIGEAQLWIVNIHASHDSEETRDKEAQILGSAIDALRNASPYIVVMGEFGSRSGVGEPVHDALRDRGFVNALSQVGGRDPASTDHVYVSENLVSAIVNAWEVRDPGFTLPEESNGWAHSDRTPIVLELAWP